MKLKQIEQLIKERRANGYEDAEIMMEIESLMPIRERIIERPLKSSPDKLKYMKGYHEMRKRLDNIQREKDNIEDYRKAKIEQALKRTGYLCFKCKVHVKCDASLNTYTVGKKPNEIREKILVSNKCPNCSAIVRQSGGYFNKS